MRKKNTSGLKYICVIFFINLCNLCFAQKSKTEFNLILRDGSVVTGTSGITKVDLTTDYGRLEIPIKNVSSVDVGIKASDVEKDKAIKLLTQLSNTNEQMRNSAYSELQEMGITTISVIRNFVYSEKYDPAVYVANSPENALNELSSKFEISADVSEKDIVSIDFQFTMGGDFPFEKIDLKTEYGSLSIPKNKIKRIEVLYTEEGSSSDRMFKLMASKHISGNSNGGWLNTGINVRNGQKIEIAASGEISLASLSGQKYKPDGVVANNVATDTYDDYGYGNYNYPTYGNVVYKINESGIMQKSGEKFSGIVNATGILYISIYETVFNAGNTGSYTVKVSVK